MPIGPIKQTIDGVDKHMCGCCHKFKKRERFSKDDPMKVPVCGDCYALQYCEELNELIKVLPQIPDENMEEVEGIIRDYIDESIQI